MKFLSAICFIAGLADASAQFSQPGMTFVQSSSGQFVLVAAPPDSTAFPFPALSSNTNYIFLQPMLLVVSCERIKQKLWDQLHAEGPWRGKIYLNLHTAYSPDERVGIIADKSPKGWNYTLALPNVLPRERFLRAMVQVVLSELANRNAGTHAAEIPLWLLEGLCGELRGLNDAEMFLPPPTLNVHGLAIRPQSIEVKWSNPGDQARTEFRSKPPLTFEQLSWPLDDQLLGRQGEVYDLSALLFVDGLRNFSDAPASFRDFLQELPHRYNWQVAFLHAFRSHFQSPLDVEKWWALQVVYFTGRGLFDRWTPEESLVKLDETLHSRVDVRTAANDLPQATTVGLQTVIREWDLGRQASALQNKLAELDLLRARVNPELISLVDAYRNVIDSYLQQRGLRAPSAANRSGGAVLDRISQSAIAQLVILDNRRDTFKPSGQTAAN